MAAQDLLETAVMTALHRIEREGECALEAVCADHPAQAERIREIVGELRQVGMVAVAGAGDDLSGECVGDFRLLERLGGGGMGVVYLAEQQSLGRRVALKLMRGVFAGDARSRERFRREIAALSKLDHPGICTVYEAGEVEGTPYLAMRYVEGETLAARLARERAQGMESSSGSGRSSGRQRVTSILTFFEKLADALHFAHEHGFVHRDVKPGNIMIEPSGQPVLLDFGLAQAVEGSDSSLTLSGDVLGTPAYMAPEQVAGRGDEIDRRTDVYALAVTLYEAVTLRRPFEAASREKLYRQILGDDPQGPRVHSQHVPRELEVVLLRALQKSPARRLATAAELGDELGRIRHHEPIRSRAPGPVLRLRRWTQRNPVAATFLVLLGIGLAVSLGFLREIQLRERETAAALESRRAQLLVEAAAKAVEDDPPLALRFALEALDITPDLPEALSEVQRAVAELRQIGDEFSHGALIWSLAVSADGRRALSAAMDATARLWDLTGENPEVVFGGVHGHSEPVRSAVFSPDESLVLTASEDKSAKLWTASGVLRCDFEHPASVTSAVFAPGGKVILTGCWDGTARTWSVEGNGIEEWRASDHQICAAFSPNGERILTYPAGMIDSPGTPATTARLWHPDGTPASPPLLHRAPVFHAAFSPDGERVLTTSMDGTARVWDGRDGAAISVLKSDDGWVISGVFCRDGTVLTCTAGGGARLWSRDGELLQQLRGQGSAVILCGAFSPDPGAPWLMTGNGDNTARVWDRTGREVAVLRGHRGGEGVGHVAFVPKADPPRMLTASQDGTIRVWELWDPEVPVLLGHEQVVTRAAFSPDGELVATSSSDGTVRLWDRDGHPAGVGVLRGHGGWMRDVCFSPRGDRLVAASNDGTAVVWDVATGEEVATLRDRGWFRSASFHPDPDRDLVLVTGWRGPKLWNLEDPQGEPVVLESGSNGGAVFSPDGTRILAAQRDGTALLYNLAGERVAELTGHQGLVLAVAFDSTSKLALTGGQGGKTMLWDVGGSSPREPTVLFEGPELPVLSARFSPDDERIVTAHKGDVARVWARDGTLLMELPGHRAGVTFAAFTPDGSRILTCSVDGTARFWFARTEDLLSHARKRTRDFTPDERRRYAHLLGGSRKGASK